MLQSEMPNQGVVRTVKLWGCWWTPSIFWSSFWIRSGCSLWQKRDFLRFLLKMLLFLWNLPTVKCW